MESGDCGNGGDFSDIFNAKLDLSKKTQEKDETHLSLKKSPKRVIHFSDGTIEEYSSEDEEVDSKTAAYTTESINPRTMTWGPWLWYQTLNVGNKSLGVCDYLGEHLASFFGITTPKYQYEIDEYYRMAAEEQERRKKEDLEMGGWTDSLTQTEVEQPPVQQSSEKF